jgi:F-type H+-transporting ATPase subunit gamma
VCRTLATVAGAKLAQTHARAEAVRANVATIRGILVRQQSAARAAGEDLSRLSPLMAAREEVRAIDLVVIGADRGLCGGYNVALGRAARKYALEANSAGNEVRLVVKGRRAETYLRFTTSIPPVESTGWSREGVTDADIDALLQRVTEDFLTGAADEVWACFTAFYSSLQHEPVTVKLLPVAPQADAEEEADPGRWSYEPAQQPCVAELLETFVRLQVADVLLEAFASEQASRMVTMQEASERADRSLAELRVHYNRLRRESITADLVGVLVASRMREKASKDDVA